jgi:hypothetical protein
MNASIDGRSEGDWQNCPPSDEHKQDDSSSAPLMTSHPPPSSPRPAEDSLREDSHIDICPRAHKAGELVNTVLLGFPDISSASNVPLQGACHGFLAVLAA